VERLELAHGTSAPISFVVPRGGVVVVVGPTGEGKTTLVRTLLGLEAPAGGDVSYGAEAITSAPPGLHARPFAWVPQEAGLLSDTLEANVALASPDVDVRHAMRDVGGESLVLATAGSRLGPGGIAVSGGERQWIALARALATKQPVLILDEPTSGLDPVAQTRVLETLAALRGSRSLLIVTHRPEPVALADTIVRLGDGLVQASDGPRRGRGFTEA
jgi:ABC-type bacteriocin/lantibiotic exporter with double-glycine peptidase domain